jgi:hypothetical protein
VLRTLLAVPSGIAGALTSLLIEWGTNPVARFIGWLFGLSPPGVACRRRSRASYARRGDPVDDSAVT